jgi:hypothetical protein
MSPQTLSFLLLAISILLAALSAATLLPFPSSTISDLGYYTLCPFAPWSTLALLFFAGLGWVLRRHIRAQPAGRKGAV